MDDGIRLVIVVVGLLICGVCLRVGIPAAVRRDWENASAILSYALFVVAPASSSIVNFGKPLAPQFAILYGLALLFSLVALYFRVRLTAPWLRRRHNDKADAHERAEGGRW